MPEEPIKCWCRKCRQFKAESEMFAALMLPGNDTATGRCNDCTKAEIKSNDPANWTFTPPKNETTPLK